jgi:hypothetical protein
MKILHLFITFSKINSSRSSKNNVSLNASQGSFVVQFRNAEGAGMGRQGI